MPLNNFIETFVEYNKNGYTINELFNFIIKASEEMLDNEVDLTELRKEFELFNDIQKTYTLIDSNELPQSVRNLFELYNLNYKNEDQILKTTYDELVKYDKLIDKYGSTIPFVFNQLTGLIASYLDLLKKWDEHSQEIDSLKRTIALSLSNSVQKMLSPMNPYIKDNMFTNEKTNKVFKNIYENYMDDSYSTNLALSAINLINPSDFKNVATEKIEALYQSSVFINSALPIKKKDIIASLKIHISLLYQNNSPLLPSFKLDKYISKEKLASHIDVILQYVFEIDSKTNIKKLGSAVQIRTHFDNVPLYEYQRKGKIKEHPVLKDEEFLNQFLEIFKGIIPTK